ncbi:helix-turn-helix transcriptional regulator [Leifsonia soli]|uniref:DNA-binding CsgD family transcriptional regulator/tetratricopeptide (TPR) repeat protein n=1 Tax=Leifsonia soli TaxID=582665 RepID=A0A852T3F3_9MICO|nr:LuxR family transcriptional regulator [Leifsonia soli]NYD75707.1 DNA-binding CsgD family transcriptional regulator/tetratricopeptide (TPR) repeat protein [Leifsonia soli]
MTASKNGAVDDQQRIDPRRNPGLLPVVVSRAVARAGWRHATRIIGQHWDAFAECAPQQLLEALKALPGEAFVEQPSYVVAANYLHQVVLGGDPAAFFNDGRFSTGAVDGKANLDTLVFLTGETAGARTNGRLEDARNAANRARDALRSMTPADRASIASDLPHLHFQWGRSLDAADAVGAIAEYEAAFNLGRLTDQPVIARRAASHVAWYHAERGRLRYAEMWLARATAEPATSGRYDVIYFLATALLGYDRGNKDADRQLSRALGLPLGEQWAAAVWLSALLETRDVGGFAQTQLDTELERHPEVLHDAGANSRYVRAAQAQLARIRPRMRIDHAPADPPTAFDRILMAAQASREGRYPDALAQSDEAIPQASAPRLQASALLLSAASHLALGHRGMAASAYRHADAIITREQLLSVYSVISPRTVSTLAEISGTPPQGGGHALAVADRPDLSAREREILALISTGMPMQNIASELFISPNTLKAGVRSLYRKLGVHSRQEAADAAKHIVEWPSP